MSVEDSTERVFVTFDQIAAELADLRERSGSPSFGLIVDRIAEERIAAGVAPEVAAPGRTTVYDAFRPGRTRLDPSLVREIVRACGVDDVEAERWFERCRQARRSPAVVVEHQEPAPVVTPRRRLGLLGAGIGINVAGRFLVAALGLPLHLDMIGTAVVAVGLGPWWGALVGVVSSVIGVLATGWSSVPFALVNVAGALVWGYGVRRGWGASYARFFALNIGVAAACTAVAAPILLALYGGEIGHGAEGVTENVLAATGSMVTAVLSSNLLTSITDKLISGFTAVAVLTMIAWPRLSDLFVTGPSER